MGIEQETAFFWASFIIITGPIIGSILGGCVISSIGGYNNPNTMTILFIAILFSVSCGLPTPFVTSYPMLMALLWGELFGGAFCLPTIMGILLNLVPPSLRTLANSWQNLVTNLLGYLPGPFVYGLVIELSGNPKSNMGLLSI